MAPNVAVPIPPIVKSPNLSVRSPAPAVSAAPTVIKFLGLEKSTLSSTQIQPAMAAINPNSTIDKPPMTGAGIDRMSAPASANAFSRTALLLRICGLVATTQMPTFDASTSSMLP